MDRLTAQQELHERADQLMEDGADDEEIRSRLNSMVRDRGWDHEFALADADVAAAVGGTWGSVGELPRRTAEVPTLRPEMVPAPFRAWLTDAAERTCVPLEMVAVPAMTALSSVVGRGVGIRPKLLDDWTVVANLWGGNISPPGTLKTPAYQEGMRHTRRLEAKAVDEFNDGKGARDAELEVIEQRIGVLRGEIKKALGADTPFAHQQEELAALLEEKEKRPKCQRFVTQDPTVEALQTLLSDNARGILLSRDELSGWIRALDRQGQEGAREFFLECWNGSGPYTTDRIGRGTTTIPSTTVAVFGGIQPGKIAPLVREATENGGDGFLSRFQLLIWPEVPAWKNVDREPDTAARDQAWRIFEVLAKESILESLGFAGGDYVPPSDQDGIPALRFDAKAQARFDCWRDDLERSLRSDDVEGTPAYTAHRAKFRSLLPSLSLIFHLVRVADADEAPGPVCAECLEMGIRWIELLDQHARKVYSRELTPGRVAAHNLLARIRRGSIEDGMAVRDVAQNDWSGLSETAEVNAGLELLEAANMVKREPRPATGTQGGRPSPTIRIHPRLRVMEGGRAAA